MSTVNLSMKRGDTKTVQFTVSNLPPTGLTGYTFWFTAKKQISDTDLQAVFEKTSANADFTVTTNGSNTVNGVVTCTINPTDTQNLPDYDVDLLYDFQVKDQSGNVTTSADGTITVSPDVTRAS